MVLMSTSSLARSMCLLTLGLPLLFTPGEAAAASCEPTVPYVSARYALNSKVEIPSDGRVPFVVTASQLSFDDALMQLDLSVSLDGELVEGSFEYETFTEEGELSESLAYFIPAAPLDSSQTYDVFIDIHNADPEAAEYYDRTWTYMVGVSDQPAAPPEPPTFSQLQLIEGVIGVPGLCCTITSPCADGTDGTYEVCANDLLRHVPWLIAGLEGDALSYGELEMVVEGGSASIAKAPMAQWNSELFEGTTYEGLVLGHKYEAMQDEYCMVGRVTSLMTGEVAEAMHCVAHGDLPDSWDEAIEPDLNEECLDEPYDPETGEPPEEEVDPGIVDGGSCACTHAEEGKGGAGGLAMALLGLWGLARRRRRAD